MQSIIMREISRNPEEEYLPGDRGWFLWTLLFLEGPRGSAVSECHAAGERPAHWVRGEELAEHQIIIFQIQGWTLFSVALQV